MAIRRPGINTSEFYYQDFLDDENIGAEYRHLDIKYASGEPFQVTSQTFDYSNPPYSDFEQRGGDIVGTIYYIKLSTNPGTIIIEDWFLNWRDEWPLRLGSNYLVNCLYKPGGNYSFLVGKEAYPFWVSQFFSPVDNQPDTYLGYPPNALDALYRS
jgi:hypothetical protein